MKSPLGCESQLAIGYAELRSLDDWRIDQQIVSIDEGRQIDRSGENLQVQNKALCFWRRNPCASVVHGIGTGVWNWETFWPHFHRSHFIYSG
jgi:hypothetical protein